MTTTQKLIIIIFIFAIGIRAGYVWGFEFGERKAYEFARGCYE